MTPDPDPTTRSILGLRYRTSLFVTALLCATALPAQALLPVGTSVGGGTDAVVSLSLPFLFPMPGGVPTGDIDVSVHGRIAPVGTLGPPADFTESVTELLAGPPSICAYWDDLSDFDGAADQVFYDPGVATPGVAVISWIEVEESLTLNGAVSFQLRLRPDGSFTIAWDERTAGNDGDCLVGASQGADPSTGLSAPNPGGDDLSAGYVAGGMFSSTSPTLYQRFTIFDRFDLANGALTFTPNAAGGYDVTGEAPFALAGPGRRACAFEPFALTFQPTSPGYVVTGGASNFDAAFASGTPLGLTDETLSNAQALPFPFVMPGGLAVSSIRVSDNGRVVAPGGITMTDFTPTVPEFLAAAGASICPFWCDLDPDGGEIYVHDLGTSFSITWHELRQFDASLPQSRNTIQLVLLPDGSFEFHYRELGFEDGVQFGGDVLIGAGPGPTSDPEGGSDLTTPGVVTISSDDVVHEFIDTNDAISPEPFTLDDRFNESLDLAAVAPPVLGQPFEVVATDASGLGTTAFYFFGLPTGLLTPAIPLGPILGPDLAACELLNDLFAPGATFVQASGPLGVPTTVADLTSAPAILAGFDLFVVSAIVLRPGQPNALVPTDELTASFGF